MGTPWSCSACGKIFGGLTGFEAHRVGKYLDRHPDYGRRCLTPDEFRAKGYAQDVRGVWREPASDEDREVLAKLRSRV
jgi:hypothetical protein